MLEIVGFLFLTVVIFTISAELWYSKKKNLKLYEKNDTITNLILGIMGIIARFKIKGITLFFWVVLYNFSFYKIETSVWSIMTLFVLNEFIYYWFHRFSHTIPFLWATHVNHHSSLFMNLSVGARTPFLNAIYHVIFWSPLPLLGFNPVDILAVETISFIAVYFQHTTVIKKMGVLEKFFNTPSNHRVHHACNENYIDKNFGNTLIVFDKLFGTYAGENEKPVFGITKNPINRSFYNMIFHGWIELFKQMRSGKKSVF